MKYSKSQRKRILNTAISIIEKDGIDKLTIRELVKKTNVGTQSVYKHFPNKDELIKTIASKLTTDYLDEVNKSALLNPKEKLIHSASFFLKKTSEHPHLMDFLFFNPKIENILPKNTVRLNSQPLWIMVLHHPITCLTPPKWKPFIPSKPPSLKPCLTAYSFPMKKP